MNYVAVFGVPYVELPIDIQQDIATLLKRQSQVRARNEAAAKKGRRGG